MPARNSAAAVRERMLTGLIADSLGSGIPRAEFIRQAQRATYSFLLTEHGGNVCAVARELGTHRNTVTRQLEKLGMKLEEFRK